VRASPADYLDILPILYLGSGGQKLCSNRLSIRLPKFVGPTNFLSHYPDLLGQQKCLPIFPFVSLLPGITRQHLRSSASPPRRQPTPSRGPPASRSPGGAPRASRTASRHWCDVKAPTDATPLPQSGGRTGGSVALFFLVALALLGVALPVTTRPVSVVRRPSLTAWLPSSRLRRLRWLGSLPQRHDARRCVSPARRGPPRRHGGLARWHGGPPEGMATYTDEPPATFTSVHGEKKNESMTYETHVSFSAKISLDSVF
jgi:hypothetical protein